MKLYEIFRILDAEVVWGDNFLDSDIESAFSADMMSDVLAHANKKTLLLTGLNNAQVIRTAEMLDMRAIVFVRNKRPNDDIIQLAMENKIVIMCTGHSLYTASGKLYASGLQGIQINLDKAEQII